MDVWIYFGVAILILLFAHWSVRRAYRRCANYSALTKLTGAQSARKILNTYQLHEIKIEEIPGVLNDYYDPKRQTVFLSQDTFHNTHLAALVITSHEVGHVLQHKEGYFFLKIQQRLLPIVNIGSSFSWVLIGVGSLLHTPLVFLIGIALLFLCFPFQLISLFVEQDANKRAKKLMEQFGIMALNEKVATKKLLNVATFTYVISIFFVVFELIRLCFILMSKIEKK